MPKVSVIVPMYNAEPYIEKCVESLKEQTLEDIEVICVDNRSTDRTVAKCRESIGFDTRFRIVVNEANNGQGYSVNHGIDLASGEFIAEVDADDWAHAEMYEKMYESAEGCDVVTCGWYDVYPSRLVVRQSVNQKIITSPMKTFSPKQRFNFLANQPHLMSAIYRRSFLLENGLRYRLGTQFEDTSLSFKIKTTANRYVFLPDCLYYYRKGVPGSGTLTIDDNEGLFEQYEEMYRWNEERNLGLEKELGVNKYYTYRWGWQRSKDFNDKLAFWERASAEFKKDVIDESFFANQDDLDNYNFIKDM